jgi:hypothetical protein
MKQILSGCLNNRFRKSNILFRLPENQKQRSLKNKGNKIFQAA